mmetsp:Transcript_49562/g.149382  ORF Transcript_49562/g.149382 Transcript_49562/m.149382 type:complete len:415 (-) Transcript_49562:1653-2897(-)
MLLPLTRHANCVIVILNGKGLLRLGEERFLLLILLLLLILASVVLLHRVLNGIHGGVRSEGIHPGLETLLPRVKMHGGQLIGGRVGDEQIQTLTLIDELPPVRRHIDHILHLNLPHGTIQFLQSSRDAFYRRDGSSVPHQLIPHRRGPQSSIGQIAEQVRIDHDELSRLDPTQVQVGRVRFEALVHSQYLGRGGRGHGSDEERIAQAGRSDVGAEGFPVVPPPFGHGGGVLLQRLRIRPPPPAGSIVVAQTPHVELQFPLAGGTPAETIVRAPPLSRQFHARLQRGVIDRLEYGLVQFLRSVGRERQAQSHERVGQSGHADAYRTMTHVGSSSAGGGVFVAIDNLVQVAGDDFCGAVEGFVIEIRGALGGGGTGIGVDGAVRSSIAHDESGEAKAGQITNCHLLLVGILHNLGT